MILLKDVPIDKIRVGDRVIYRCPDDPEYDNKEGVIIGVRTYYNEGTSIYISRHDQPNDEPSDHQYHEDAFDVEYLEKI